MDRAQDCIGEGLFKILKTDYSSLWLTALQKLEAEFAIGRVRYDECAYAKSWLVDSEECTLNDVLENVSDMHECRGDAVQTTLDSFGYLQRDSSVE